MSEEAVFERRRSEDPPYVSEERKWGSWPVRQPIEEGLEMPERMSISEAAEYLKLDRRTVWRAAREGRLRAAEVIRHGKSRTIYQFRPEDVREYSRTERIANRPKNAKSEEVVSAGT